MGWGLHIDIGMPCIYKNAKLIKKAKAISLFLKILNSANRGQHETLPM